MDPVAGLTTGSTVLDVIIALVAVLGGKGAGDLAMRKFSNGFSEKIQPITRSDLREELKPLIQATEQTGDAIKEHIAYMKGRLDGRVDR